MGLCKHAEAFAGLRLLENMKILFNWKKKIPGCETTSAVVWNLAILRGSGHAGVVVVVCVVL